MNLKTTTLSKVDSIKPNLEREFSDKYKGSDISIRILAFKTGSTIEKTIAMPKRMYFTTKFYTFGEVKTEKVILTQPNAQTIGRLAPDQQYLLGPLVGQAPKDPRRKDAAQQAGLQIDFSFDPNKFALSDNENPVEEQHEIFKQFMYERALTIDVWDADSTAHFGQCRIPLSLFLR